MYIPTSISITKKKNILTLKPAFFVNKKISLIIIVSFKCCTYESDSYHRKVFFTNQPHTIRIEESLHQKNINSSNYDNYDENQTKSWQDYISLFLVFCFKVLES